MKTKDPERLTQDLFLSFLRMDLKTIKNLIGSIKITDKFFFKDSLYGGRGPPTYPTTQLSVCRMTNFVYIQKK
jgi:hypothetical protein